MHVGLITYSRAHRKTLDVTLKLMTRGCHQITWLAFPFRNLAARLPEHQAKEAMRFHERPPQIMDFDPIEFCKRNGIDYRECHWDDPGSSDWTGPNGMDVYLHCTAKIVPAGFIEGRTILNVHPGLLPKNRGVDAFKWAIVNGWPIGVTLHAIDEEIDRGIILYRRTVPILPDDTLDAVASRSYAFECDLLANFDAHLDNLRHNWTVGDAYSVSHRRIPLTVDTQLRSVFADQRHILMEAKVPETIAIAA